MSVLTLSFAALAGAALLLYFPVLWPAILLPLLGGPILYAVGRMGWALFGSWHASTKKPQG